MIYAGTDIQSDLHRTKRRFTDFIFQRVKVGVRSDQVPERPSSARAQQNRTIRTPRSVANIKYAASQGTRNQVDDNGVPVVRATSLGAGIREDERLLAASRRDKEDAMKRALNSHPVSPSAARIRGGLSGPLHQLYHHLPRKFHISRSSSPWSALAPADTGVHKNNKKPGEAHLSPRVAVLIEKLVSKEPQPQTHISHAERAAAVVGRTEQKKEKKGKEKEEEERQPRRKRPVVNRAERQWRENNKESMAAARQHIFSTLDREAQQHDKGTWENESDILAEQFEQIALELEGGDDAERDEAPPSSPGNMKRELALRPAAPLKYPPRIPNVRASRPAGAREHTGEEEQVQGNDENYVYDTYIRRPANEPFTLGNDNGDIDMTDVQKVGVIVISPEDEEYWDQFVEEDEDDETEWDSDDSNGMFFFFFFFLPPPPSKC